MNIIDAVWDRRNFNRQVYEVILDMADLENIEDTVRELRLQDFADCYVTLKMPVANLKALHYLQSQGFDFMETQFSISKKLRDYTPPKIFSKMAESFEILEVGNDQALWHSAVDSIEEGMFETDRIYLDPLLSSDISRTRYRNWAYDLCAQESAHMWLLRDKHSQQDIAFGIYKMDEKRSKADGILGAVFNDYKQSGYGAFIIDVPIQLAREKGARVFRTAISSNNVGVLTLYSYLGFVVDKELYVLRLGNFTS